MTDIYDAGFVSQLFDEMADSYERLRMYLFLVPLLLGFAFNLASAFTTAFSQRWDERRGALASFVFRNVQPRFHPGRKGRLLSKHQTLLAETAFTPGPEQPVPAVERLTDILHRDFRDKVAYANPGHRSP